uniref:Glycoside hydrolase family 38 central domain-containing protein n=1 Tax=Romanomermis culicivorax TaxID=13658 RepID=A0A915IBC9_ROMCU
VCQSLDAIAQLDPLDWGDVDVLHKNLGIVQHHDGVSGTAKQHVTDDYSKLLHQGVMECQQVANDAMKYLGSSQRQSPPYHSLCTLANETICNVSQTADSVKFTDSSLLFAY